ncbi:MAG TPA: hypothetical protein VL595_11945 [Pseudonocardia sp.]|jgi:hypothetical protein|nr:hypothetical protein [Pseudonocardia sp.]
MPPLVIPWTDGPVSGAGRPAVVSVTDFTLNRWTYYPVVARTGLRLRMGWYAMPGAVGLWLWTLPLTTRTGSISVWTDSEALREFVGLPLHVEVMRRSRDRGTVRSTTWSVDEFDATEQRERACRWILSES